MKSIIRRIETLKGMTMLFDGADFNPFDKAESKALRAFDLYEDGKISQALLELEGALQINPANSTWHFNKALALDSASRFEEAIAEYETTLQANPNDLETLNSLAIDYTRIGLYDKAIETFEYIQEIDPTFEPGYCNRIITYTEMEKYDMAEQMFYLAQQIKPDCALCFYNIGNALFVQGKYKKAISCWLKTVELDNEHPQINYRIAQGCWANEDFENAYEYFLEELRNNPADTNIILNFGLFLLEKNEIEAAKEKFNRILEFTPNDAEALFYLGEIAFNSKNYETAIALFNNALISDKTLAGVYYRLAQYEIMRDNKNKARIYLVSELNQNSENTDVLVSMGSMFLAIGDIDYATHCLLKAVDADFANDKAYYYLGLVNAINGHFEDAIEFFSNSLDINPKNILTLKDCAYVYFAMGKLNEAEQKIKMAKKLSENGSEFKILERKIKAAQTKELINNLFHKFKT